MVILIGGAGYIGKTLMAQNLLEKYKMPYLSIDHLKMGICRSNSDCGFTAESKDEIITEKLWPIIKGIVMTNIENGQNIIIEGCYFPNSISELNEHYLSSIVFLYIIFSEEYIRKNFANTIIGKRNVIEKRISPIEYSEELLETYILAHKKNKEICLHNGIHFIEIKNNYEKEIETMYTWIDEALNR